MFDRRPVPMWLKTIRVTPQNVEGESSHAERQQNWLHIYVAYSLRLITEAKPKKPHHYSRRDGLDSLLLRVVC